MKGFFLLSIFLLGMLAAVLFASGGGAAPPCGKGNHPSCPTTTAPTTTAPLPTTTVSTDCTAELSPGGDISAFEGSLAPGDVGCLHGGIYVGASWVLGMSGTVSASITLQSYPGERAILDGNGGLDILRIPASYLNVRDITLRNVAGAGAAAIWGQNTSSHVLIAGLEVGPVAGQGIFTERTTSFWTLDRNYVHDVGQDVTRQTHGLYIEGADQRLSNNLIAHAHFGFGIQIYPYARRVRVVSNTVDDTLHSGIVFGGSGSGPEGTGVSDVDIVNNVVTNVLGNGEVGIQCYQTPSDYRIHHNIVFGRYTAISNCTLGSDNALVDPLYMNGYHLGDGSPGVDTGDLAWLYSPDLDGVTRPQGAGVDKGAYER